MYQLLVCLLLFACATTVIIEVEYLQTGREFEGNTYFDHTWANFLSMLIFSIIIGRIYTKRNYVSRKSYAHSSFQHKHVQSKNTYKRYSRGRWRRIINMIVLVLRLSFKSLQHSEHVHRQFAKFYLKNRDSINEMRLYKVYRRIRLDILIFRKPQADPANWQHCLFSI